MLRALFKGCSTEVTDGATAVWSFEALNACPAQTVSTFREHVAGKIVLITQPVSRNFLVEARHPVGPVATIVRGVELAGGQAVIVSALHAEDPHELPATGLPIHLIVNPNAALPVAEKIAAAP